MSKVRALAALPVKEILRDSPVHELSRASYWKAIRESKVPVMVVFYSNMDPESQRLATLVRYVSIKYRDKISFYRVMLTTNGKPAKAIAAEYQQSYSLDKTPGILFYDNDPGKMELEDEHSISRRTSRNFARRACCYGKSITMLCAIISTRTSSTDESMSDNAFAVRPQTAEEVIQKPGEHAKEHGIRQVTPELIEKVKANIRDA